MATDSYEAFGLLLAQVWGGEIDGRVMRRVEGESGLLLAADAQERRHLLVPIADDVAFVQQRWASMQLSDWRHGDQRYMQLTCSAHDLAHVFASLADSVVKRVDKGGEDPAHALQHVLKEWRTLLKSAPSLSEEEARGLFGELWVLKHLVERNPHFGLNAWVGPNGGLHDFSTANGEIEVKSSSTDGLDIVVSSLRQLEPSKAGRPLLLLRLRVETSPQGTRLRDLFDEIAGMGVLRDELMTKVAGAGYIVGRDPESHRFTLVGEPIGWWVDGKFPGLRSNDIPEARRTAIRRVRYVLDLVSAGSPIPAAAVADHFDRMMAP